MVEPGDLLPDWRRGLEIPGLAVGSDVADLCEHTYFADRL